MDPRKHPDERRIQTSSINSLENTFLVFTAIEEAESVGECNFTDYVEGVALEPVLHVDCAGCLGEFGKALREEGGAVVDEGLVAEESGHGVERGEFSALGGMSMGV